MFLQDAWQEAIQQIEAMENTLDTTQYYEHLQRGLAPSTIRSQFPWAIYFRSGYEKTADFNLPDAVSSPYFGLPKAVSHDLPDEPFHFLNRYQREHHAIFFGRGAEVRELYFRLSGSHSAPVIAFFGQSGVGKSSLLDAGLIPILEAEHEVRYMRRDAATGLLTGLANLLEELEGQSSSLQLSDPNNPYNPIWQDIEQLEYSAKSLQGEARQQVLNFIQKLRSQQQYTEEHTAPVVNLRRKWLQIEAASTQKSLILIIDQVEEVFTRPISTLPNELYDFLNQLHQIFHDPRKRPKGRILLSYRKEFDPDITEALQQFHLPKEKVFLSRLRRAGIVEIVKGLTTTERLRNKYNLKIETGLPIMIANDLMADKNSPVAPILQIILTKLWQQTRSLHQPTFKIEDYLTLKEQGILLSDFFDQQMMKIVEWEKIIKKQVEGSGLALDILQVHTTRQGTATAHNLEDLRKLYNHRTDVLDLLLQKFADLYLLSKIDQNQIVLTHDTLAPIVKNAHEDSSRPGQRARRILDAKMMEYRRAPESTLLDDDEL